jgi:hypothetical protein
MSRGGKRQCAGRNRAPARAGITVRVDTATAARFAAYCAAKGISQSAAFTAWVSRLPNAPYQPHGGSNATPPDQPTK